MLKKSARSILTIIIFTHILPGCGNSGKTYKDIANITPKVSVYYLHQKKSCMTCKAVGNISKITVEKYFQKELNEGKVKFFDLDISKAENDSIAKKFECAWSGLYILSTVNGKEVAEDLTDVAFMYAVNKPDTLEQIIKSSITKKI